MVHFHIFCATLGAVATAAAAAAALGFLSLFLG